jgi:hypothetical protein
MRWPRLDYPAERPVVETLHAYLQVVGKLPTRALPWRTHGWHVALRVVPSGFRTYPVLAGEHEAELLVDCLGSRLVLETSSGFRGEMALHAQPVATFYEELAEILKRGGIGSSVAGAPNEVEEAVPFGED